MRLPVEANIVAKGKAVFPGLAPVIHLGGGLPQLLLRSFPQGALRVPQGALGSVFCLLLGLFLLIGGQICKLRFIQIPALRYHGVDTPGDLRPCERQLFVGLHGAPTGKGYALAVV